MTMKLRTFAKWVEDNGMKLPEGDEVSANWFIENHIPMIVLCNECGKEILSLHCYADENSLTYCDKCAK